MMQPTTLDVDQLRAFVADHDEPSTSQVAEHFGVGQSIARRNLQATCREIKRGKWVPKRGRPPAAIAASTSRSTARRMNGGEANFSRSGANGLRLVGEVTAGVLLEISGDLYIAKKVDV